MSETIQKEQLLEFNEAALLAAAQQRTGLSDFGDPGFLAGLRVLIESINQEAQLHYWGQKSYQKKLIHHLVNRLHIQEQLKLHPEILQVPIQRPLFIVGLPRTGSTLLQRLLSQAPSSRWLHYWELLTPCPSPEYQTQTDPRIKRTEREIKAFSFLAPVQQGHFMDVLQPEECSHLLENDFVSNTFSVISNIPSYEQWLESQERTRTYHYYRQQLQILGWKWSGMYWIFKSPGHLENLATIMSIFPDACIVQTHRNPLAVIPSISKLHKAFRQAYSDRIQPEILGRQELNYCAKAAERGLKAREIIPPQQIYDVYYSDLVADPIATVRRIHDYFAYPYTPELEHNLHQYMTENPQHKHGVHRYSLEEFGLNAELIKEKFADYCQKFNILEN